MIERYGSGIIRVRKICSKFGVKDPDFYEISNGFQVILYNEKIFEIDNVTDVTDVTDNVTDVTNSDAIRAEKLLDFMMENNKITVTELSKYLEVTKWTSLCDIEKLKEKKLLKRIGPEKGGYWQITK